MRFLAFLALFSCLASGTAAQIPYQLEPDWLSAETDDYGTGCDLADVDGDGDLDLAVSNGNDIVQAPNYVYLNAGGLLPAAASWVSTDQRYSGHCEFADIDHDGLPELMVANYISAGWGPAQVQVYRNLGGALETAPSWESAVPLHSFRASFGDPDGDGDLDLAVATGESYNGFYEPNYIFFNAGGVLQTVPGWTSADSDACLDVQFVDIDGDGDLDLAFLPAGGRIKIYFNEGGAISAVPGWQAAASDYGNTFDFADVDGDGFLDLAVANNNQLGGAGRFQVFLNDAGQLDPVPSWISATGGFGSAAVLADIDGDGDQDLVGGRWWGRVQVYLNQGGAFAGLPDWESSAAFQSVIENIAFGDLDDGGVFATAATFPADDERRLFYLPHRHLQGIDGVAIDGVELPAAGFCFHRQAGWVSVAAAPATSVTVRYRYSRTLDMAVSNWDGATYLFGHDQITAVAAGPAPGPTALASLRAFPNPFNPRTTIAYALTVPSPVLLEIYDLQGRRTATLADGPRPAGEHAETWDATGLASGIYLYRLQVGDRTTTGKLSLVR